MKRLIAIAVALLVAGCASGPGPTPIVIYVTPAPSIAAIASQETLVSPSTSPVASTRATTPAPSKKPSYPSDWLRHACATMTALLKGFSYRTDLETALTYADYNAIAQAGMSITDEGLNADSEIKLLPPWKAAAKLKVRMASTAEELIQSGVGIRSGGENYSYDVLDYGVRRYGDAVAFMTATTRMFTSVADTYDFDCFGQ